MPILCFLIIFQSAVSSATNIPTGSVNVIVGSVGGGYGGKGAPSPLPAAVGKYFKLQTDLPIIIYSFSAAIAAQVLGAPVKIVMTLNDCMSSVGHRPPARADYQIGFMNSGLVNALEVHWYTDSGYSTGGSVSV